MICSHVYVYVLIYTHIFILYIDRYNSVSIAIVLPNLKTMLSTVVRSSSKFPDKPPAQDAESETTSYITVLCTWGASWG